ncbi:MAG: DUF1028 domain-containing protein [Lautropia sp.]
MTWSIIARDAHGNLGMAIASRFFAVGALCLHARSDVGALSTQALVNPLYGPAGIAALAAGTAAADVVADLIGNDAGRDHRQLHLIGARGAPAAYTGTACIDWCGHLVEDDFSVAGNMLAGPQVLAETARAFRASNRPPGTGPADAVNVLAERLLAAMQAGEAAGGDKRGRQGAALRVVAGEDYPLLDLRVDDHDAPLDELHRLLLKSRERFQPFVACLARRADPVGVTDRDEIQRRVDAYHR